MPYPGVTSRERLLWPNSDEMLSQILGEPLRRRAGTAHGQFRTSVAGDTRNADIHIDLEIVWAGVLFLTLPEHCRGGTEFFRHKRYKTDRAPLNDADLKQYGAIGTSRTNVLTQLITVEGKDRSNWDLIMTAAPAAASAAAPAPR